MPLLHPATGGGYIAAPMGACPDENVLVQLAHGGVESPSLRATLESHLDGCVTCRQLVAAVAGGSAPIVPQGTQAVLRAGATLGRYRIERLLGSGGMGVLYEAHDTRLERRVALKLMHPSHDDEVGKARLWREAQAMARLSHPNVVNVFDLGEYEGQLFVAMELVEGGTLRDWLKVPHPPAEVVARLADAGEGLAAAHRAGVVHRDFKPENVLLSADGRARVTDFGLARPGEPRAEAVSALATGPIDITRTGTMMGTPAYMSPEQLLRQPADARSDQYSFCVTLYEALYDRRPHDGATLDQVRAQVLKGTVSRPSTRGNAPSERVWAALARGLSLEPAHRFPSMDALLAALRPRPKAAAWQWVAVAGAAIAAATLLVGLSRAELSKAPVPPVAVAAPALAAPPVVAAPAVAPSAPSAPMPPAGMELVLRPGESQVVHFARVARLGVADPDVVEVTPLPGFDVKLVGKMLGQTTLRVWTEDGQKLEYPVRVEAESAFALAVGERKVLAIPNLSRLAIGDSAIADAKTLGNNKVEVTGVGAGTTTLLAWRTGGERLTWTVRVRGANAPVAPAQPPDPIELTLRKGEEGALDFKDIKRVAVGDPKVADVKVIGNNQLLVIARGEGRTNVLVWTPDGARHEVKVLVLPSTAP